MAVVDEAWLGVWWPWLLVWVATVGLLVAAGAIVAVHRRDGTPGPPRGGISYLDETAVMNLFRQYGGRPMPQEVEERVSRIRELAASTQLSPVEANAKRGVTEEVSRTYVDQAEAITVISIIIDFLERAHGITDVDLTEQEVVPSAALGKALRNKRPGAGIRIGDLGGFVSISGPFRVVESDDDSITFEAPLAGTDGAAEASTVRITCANDGLLTKKPSGCAWCLGHVDGWDAEKRTLSVDPIAVFR